VEGGGGGGGGCRRGGGRDGGGGVGGGAEETAYFDGTSKSVCVRVCGNTCVWTVVCVRFIPPVKLLSVRLSSLNFGSELSTPASMHTCIAKSILPNLFSTSKS